FGCWSGVQEYLTAVVVEAAKPRSESPILVALKGLMGAVPRHPTQIKAAMGHPRPRFSAGLTRRDLIGRRSWNICWRSRRDRMVIEPELTPTVDQFGRSSGQRPACAMALSPPSPC